MKPTFVLLTALLLAPLAALAQAKTLPHGCLSADRLSFEVI